jgi:hypothetical protein
MGSTINRASTSPRNAVLLLALPEFYYSSEATWGSSLFNVKSIDISRCRRWQLDAHGKEAALETTKRFTIFHHYDGEALK